MKWASAAALVVVILAAAGCTDTSRSATSTGSAPIPSSSTVARAPTRPRQPAARIASVTTFPSAETLATALVQTQRLLDSRRTNAATLAQAGRTQQLAYRQLVITPGWRATVLAQLPAALRPIARDTIDAGTQLRLLSTPHRTLPRWRIVRAAPAGTLLRYYQQAQAATGIDWAYLAAINFVETRFGRVRGTSPAGAQGPMQFLPSTWARIGRGNINSPRDAILAAARFLATYGAPKDMARALYTYNPSTHYVAGITRYAHVMQRDPRVFYGYYFWQVIYRYTRGDVVLLEGYDGRHRAR